MMRDLPDAPEIENALDDVLAAPDVALAPFAPY